MEKHVECLLGSDLLPWERDYFAALLPAFESRMGMVVRSWDKAGVLQGRRLWLIARDWRRALQAVPSRYKGKVFVSVLGVKPRPRWLGFINKPWNPRSDLSVQLLAHSPYAYRFLKEMDRIPEAGLNLVPLPGLLLETLKRQSSVLQIGNLSALASEANLAYLVSVAHYVSRLQVPVQFQVLEQGALVPHFHAMLKDLGLEKFFVPLSPTAGGMDVLIHAPSTAEHFLPVLWKGAQGIPVLSSDLPGIETLLSDGQDGFVIPVNEVKPMGELIARLVQNEDLRSALGVRLRQGLASRYPLDRILSLYEEIFFLRTPVQQKVAA